MKNINLSSGFKRIAAVLLAVAIWIALIESYGVANDVSPDASIEWWDAFFEHLLHNLLQIGGISLMWLTIGIAVRFIYRGFTKSSN